MIFTNTILAADTVVDIPDQAKLEAIRIPLFADFSAVAGSASTVFSLVATIGSLATIGIVIFWIVKIIQLAVAGIQSEGKQEKMQELIKRLQNILVGAFMSFLFPVILSLIGIFAGIGTIFEWPRMFRSCEGSGEYDYYFQAFLAQPGENAAQSADSVCGYNTTGGANTNNNLQNEN